MPETLWGVYSVFGGRERDLFVASPVILTSKGLMLMYVNRIDPLVPISQGAVEDCGEVFNSTDAYSIEEGYQLLCIGPTLFEEIEKVYPDAQSHFTYPPFYHKKFTIFKVLPSDYQNFCIYLWGKARKECDKLIKYPRLDDLEKLVHIMLSTCRYTDQIIHSILCLLALRLKQGDIIKFQKSVAIYGAVIGLSLEDILPMFVSNAII